MSQAETHRLSIVRCLLVVAAVVGTGLLAPAIASAEVHVQEGVVVSAGMDKLVFSDADGKQQTQTVDEMTKITVHGKPARLEELKLGMRIRVMLDEKMKVLAVATVDDVKSPE